MIKQRKSNNKKGFLENDVTPWLVTLKVNREYAILNWTSFYTLNSSF